MDKTKKAAPADARAKLAHLQTLKVKIDASDSELAQLVPQVEATLDALRLGVPINQTIDVDEDGFETLLSFQKMGKQWRLTVETPVDYDGRVKVEPLSDVARDRRARIVAEHLPSILDTAIAALEARVLQRQQAISTAKELVDTVGRFVAEGQAPADSVSKKEAENPLANNLLVSAARAALGIAAAAAANSEMKQGRPENAKALVDGAKRLVPHLPNPPKVEK